MKRMLFAGAVALAVTTPALAADLIPPPGPPPQAPATYVPTTAPIYNWGGIYVGLNGGYGFGNSEWNYPAPGISTGNFNVDGGLVGGTLGFNYQMGSFVLGVEGDADWTDISGTTSATNAACGSCKTSNDWLGTVRGRVGYAIDRVLVYGTAGGAFGNIQASTPGSATNNSTEFGWAAGAGVEFAITENLTAKVEYLFVDLANGSCTTACGSPPGAAVPVSFDASLIRAGLNFKFNGF